MLVVEGLSKDFGGQRALDAVDLSVRAGELHALLGENGAGKSTLIKLLAGLHRPTAGTITVAGQRLADGHTPLDAARHGLCFVHQDLGLIDELSVAENIALELGYQTRHRLVSMRSTARRAAELTARQGVEIDPTRLVGELPQAEKVMVAIARAFHADARVIVLDEVSASLPAPETERLQAAVRAASRTGVAFIWVTHRLDELHSFIDRFTVLRDGRRVVSADAGGVTDGQLVEWIVGGPVVTRPHPAESHSAEPKSAGATHLIATGLLAPGLSAPVDLQVAAGETLGVTGLIGSGAQVVVRVLGGSPHIRAGSARLDGAPLPLGRPRAMRLAGCNYVPGDRKAEGVFTALSVRENLFPARVASGPEDRRWRAPRTERAATRRLLDAFAVRPRDAAERPIDTLSGGNQQKVIFARALRTLPKLLVLTDPTAGVDIGARAELYALTRRAAADGAAVVIASSDFAEIVNHTDRALVMVRGRVVRELAGSQLTRDALAAASYAAREEQYA